jgi:hypothetical protein
MKHNIQSGFAAVEALLVVVILAILSGTGYFVWHAKHSADKSLDSASQSSPVADGRHAFIVLGEKLPTGWQADLISQYWASLSSLDKQCTVQAAQTELSTAKVSDPQATIVVLEKKVGTTDTNGYSTSHKGTSTIVLRTWAGEKSVTAYSHDTVNSSGKTVNSSETAYIVSDGHYDSIMMSCVSASGMQRAEEAAGALQINS